MNPKMTRVKRLQKELDEMVIAYQADGAALDIRLSWRAFKSLVEQLSDEQWAGFGAEIENHESSPDVLWAQWGINVVDDDGCERQVGFLWFRDVTPELLFVNQGLFYWPECEESLEDFWRQVEAMPVF